MRRSSVRSACRNASRWAASPPFVPRGGWPCPLDAVLAQRFDREQVNTRRRPGARAFGVEAALPGTLSRRLPRPYERAHHAAAERIDARRLDADVREAALGEQRLEL